MREINFTSFKITDTETNVAINTTINSNDGFDNLEVKEIIISVLNNITGISQETGNPNINYSLDSNVINASQRKI